MTITRRTLARIGLTTLAGLATLAGLPAAAQEPGLTATSIRIGMFAPLSGANMAYGFDVANAAKMYFDKINKRAWR